MSSDGSNPVYDVVEGLAKLVEEKRWEERLHPDLLGQWRDIKSVLRAFDELLKRFDGHCFTLDDLRHIEIEWSRAQHIGLNISSVCLTLLGKGYAEYGGLTFRTLREFQKFIGNFSTSDSNDVFMTCLKTEPHRLEIHFF